MTIYTKTITAALALMLGAAPLVGTVSAETSNGTVSFANESGALSIFSANDIEFGEIDLANVSDFTPSATNNSGGKIILEQTKANPTGTYGVTVQQTGDWDSSGKQLDKSDMPIAYEGTSITAAQDYIASGTSQPVRGQSNSSFTHTSAAGFTLNLEGDANLTNALNKSLTSTVTWTLTTGA